MAGHERVPRRLGIDVIHVAWMAVVLGIVGQLILLALKAAGPTREWAAELAGKISWAVIVCTALAVVRALSNAAQGAMGLAGLLGAPLATATARVVQKSTASALDLVDAATKFPFVLVGIRALEYAVLGLLIARLARCANVGIWHYVRRGLLVGVIFGSVVAVVKGNAGAALLTALAVDELLFPIGCSIALFASERVGSEAVKKSLASRGFFTAEPTR
jgi:hypothetical protein